MNVYWFRKCLRLHDNAGLTHIAKEHSLGNINNLLPLFILDDHFIKES